METAEDRLFRMLGDPTRRRLLELIGEGERNVKALTHSVAVSQPAVSQHLRALREAGLASERRVGRERLYRLEPNALRPLGQWLEDHGTFWAERMEGLGAYLRRQHGEDKV
jgi:DNA-binding transcriptional ArsR family regulator